MKKIFHIILILCSFNIYVLGSNKNVKVQNDAFSPISPWTFGAEWSYVGTFHYSTRFNYFNTEGYRQNASSDVHGYWNNGEALLHVGYNLSERWNLSVYAGILGMADIHNALPVSIRATHYFSKDSSTKDTWLAFVDLGSGISIKHEPQEILTGKIGGGYRFSLSPDTKLDFIAAFRLAYTHPQIMDGDDMITLKWTNRNTAFLQSFSIGMAINF